MTTEMPAIGTRVVLAQDVERYPHFIARKGMTGTVTSSDEEVFAVRMDDHLEGAEEWDNEVCWYPRNCDDDPTPDITVLP